MEVVRPGMIESRVRRDRLGNRFLLGSLVVWRLTHLIAEEDGPADVVVRMRARAGDGAACLLEQATRERELSIGGGGSVDGLLWQQAEGAIG